VPDLTTMTTASGIIDESADDGAGTASDEPKGRWGPLVAPSVRWQHGLAALWIVLLAVAVLAPALAHGWIIGRYDLLGRSSLTSQAGVVVRGSYVNTDPIVQMIPWTTLNWTQVHLGFLLLRNPYSGLGLPLTFKWQSASFGVPSLIGYLMPLRYAYTAAVVASLAATNSDFTVRPPLPLPIRPPGPQPAHTGTHRDRAGGRRPPGGGAAGR
jgi:hypothetical protein